MNTARYRASVVSRSNLVWVLGGRNGSGILKVF